MKYIVIGLFIIATLAQTKAEAKDVKTPETKNPEKRAAIDLPATAYATSAPALPVSHTPTIIPAVTATPGIVYAPEKHLIATTSPAQFYAKPSPHLKISDTVLNGHQQYAGLLTNQYYQGPQTFHSLPKIGFNGQNYAVTAPVAAQLAYSKHQVLAQPVYAAHSQIVAQPQLQHIAAFAQPQAVYAHPQVSYVQPSHVPHYSQSQLLHPQVSYVQPQVNYQPQIYHHQPVAHQVAYAQPQALTHAVVAQPVAKVTYAQPAVLAQQVYQPVAAKGEGAVSYASFSQGHGGHVQYAAPVAKVNIAAPIVAAQPAAAVLSKQVVAPVATQVYQHYQPQQIYAQSHHQDNGHSASQLYASSAKVSYSQPHVSYATQYFGKIAHGSPLTYSGYNH